MGETVEIVIFFGSTLSARHDIQLPQSPSRVIMDILTEHSLNGRHCSKCLWLFEIFYPPNDPIKKGLLLSPFYRLSKV